MKDGNALMPWRMTGSGITGRLVLWQNQPWIPIAQKDKNCQVTLQGYGLWLVYSRVCVCFLFTVYARLTDIPEPTGQLQEQGHLPYLIHITVFLCSTHMTKQYSKNTQNSGVLKSGSSFNQQA